MIMSFYKNIVSSSVVLCLLLASPLVLGVSPEKAAELARNHIQGRILDVKAQEVQGKRLYFVKVITSDSRVVIVRVDAETGRIL